MTPTDLPILRDRESLSEAEASSAFREWLDAQFAPRHPWYGKPWAEVRPK